MSTSPPPVQPYPARPTNGLAILALILAFAVAPVGIVLGHLALGQIRQTGEGGRELAIAGLVIGYVLSALVVLMVIAYVVFAIVGLGMMTVLFGTIATTT